MLLSLLNYSCLQFEDCKGQTDCVNMPYFGHLYSYRLKDVGRTEVYVHTLRLREKSVAARSPLLSSTSWQRSGSCVLERP